MDNYMQRISNGDLKFDSGGKVAASGVAKTEIVELAMSHPFFAEEPPKSTGRELFGDDYLENLLLKFSHTSKEDMMASLLEITVQSVKRAVEQENESLKKVKLVAVAGGGALNETLMKRLKSIFSPEVEVALTSEFGIPVMAREAMAFAALGYAHVNQISSNLITATGAKKETVLGEWHPAYK
jgi:anhydro-N-acetylmuramic acid kinase